MCATNGFASVAVTGRETRIEMDKSTVWQNVAWFEK